MEILRNKVFHDIISILAMKNYADPFFCYRMKKSKFSNIIDKIK